MLDQDYSTEDVSADAPISDEEINKLLMNLETTITDFLDITLGYDKKISYTVCTLDLIDIILRVDMRKRYFMIVHGTKCNEEKKAALFAYWILKLRPILITDPQYVDADGYNNAVNELFAIHYLLSALNGVGKIKSWDGHEGVELELCNPFIKRLRYSFRFRQISLDSMLLLADTITTETLKNAK